jgi:hypothetical protein
LASVILPRPESDLKTELSFSVKDSNIGYALQYRDFKPCGKKGIVTQFAGFCKVKERKNEKLR